MDLTLFILTRRWGLWWAIDLAGISSLAETSGLEIGESGIVVCFITAVIPAGLLGGANFMKRKSPPGESRAEQNKGAASTAFRTSSDCCIWSEHKSLPEITTVGTKQRDVNTRDQWSLRVALGHNCVRRRLMQPTGLLQGVGLRRV
jgi:hypothetical protein